MKRALLALVLLAPVAHAHGAIGPVAPGDTLATAPLLGLPAYVFDDAPGGVTVHYFRFASPGDVVRLRLVAPPGREPVELPVVFVFSAGLDAEFAAPSGVESPADVGGAAFAAVEETPGASGPLGAAWSVLLDREIAVGPGTHVVAVRTQQAGPLGLVVEEPRARWILPFVLPGLRDDVRAWAGAPAWPAVLAAAIGAAAVGAWTWRVRAREWSFLAMTAHAHAATCAASGAALLTDALRTGAGAAFVAGAFAAALLALAAAAPRARHPRAWQRALLACAGVGAFVGFAGFLWGPVFAIAGSLVPEPAARA